MLQFGGATAISVRSVSASNVAYIYYEKRHFVSRICKIPDQIHFSLFSCAILDIFLRLVALVVGSLNDHRLLNTHRVGLESPA